MRTIITLLLVGLSCPLLNAQQQYDSLLRAATQATAADSLQKAESLYRQALRLEPDNAKNALAFSNLGSILKRLKRYDEAIDAYTMALNITPYATAIRMNRGSLYMELGHSDRAYTDFCNVLDLIPDDRDARLFRATINMEKKHYDEAKTDYLHILKRNANDYAARTGMILLKELTGHPREALADLETFGQQHPDDLRLKLMRVNLLAEYISADEAMMAIDNLLKSYPKEGELYVRKAELVLDRQHADKKQARRLLTQALELGIKPERITDLLMRCGK